MECLLVGYCENSKSFRMWNPVTRKIIISRDVIFREEATYESGSVNEDDYDSLFPLDEVTVELEVTREKPKVDNNGQESTKSQQIMIEDIVEKTTTNSGMEETTQQPQQIEIDEDQGPNQETD